MPDTNPLLDEINGLSPGAKAALMQAHQGASNPLQGMRPPNPAIAAARQQAQQSPEPPAISLQAPSQMQAPPQMGVSSPQPHVSLASQPKGTLSGDQQALEEMAGKKAPLESVYSRVTGSDFGKAHPLAGKILGALGQIPATAVDVAASAAVPRIGALIPGTSLNRGLQLKGLEARIAGEEANAEKEAQTEAFRAATGKTSAETSEIAPNNASRRALEAAQTKNQNTEAAEHNANLANGPSLATAYSHAVNEALKAGRDPSADPIVQHLSDAITSIQKQPVAAPGTKTVQLEVKGKPHQVLINERTGEMVKDLGESGEKPPSVSLNLGREEKNDLLKAYQPTLDSAERMNVMTDAFEKAVKNHDQQAMLNLLANHLGMTMGLQKGARMTKDIINEAQQSQPWLQGIKAKFDSNGYLSGVTLSPEQMRQMVNLGQERYAEDVKKSRATGQYLGAKDDGPERIPGKSTINYYIWLANGDPAKAKQLLAEDGWSVK